MNFDEFNDQVTTQYAIRANKIQGISNIARVMDGCIFLGGPNLERYDGQRPYAFSSRLSFSPLTHLYFCVIFKNHAKEFHQALLRLDDKRLNNCKLILDEEGLFVSTNTEINSGTYLFSNLTDVRVRADYFVYHLSSQDTTATATIEWIIKRFNGDVKNIPNNNLYTGTKDSSNKFNYNIFLEKSTLANYFINRNLGIRFIASLATKPFVILTGLSGSGKTKLAQTFATWICEDKKQFCIVPVGADWTNREPLLGFPNSLNNEEYIKPDNNALDLLIEASKPGNEEKPFFLILDEMNLSHVERYFADFLSIMESKDQLTLYRGKSRASTDKEKVPSEISWPKNFFIIGTVNIDETTYMFSPKVLDRANVIEFRVTEKEMETYLISNSKMDIKSFFADGAPMAADFINIVKSKNIDYSDKQKLNITLIAFFNELKKTGAEFGYRTASEILRFAGIVTRIEPDLKLNEIIDAAIVQKLLPKVHGSRRKLEPVLKSLGNLCIADEINIEDFLNLKSEPDYSNTNTIKYPISLEKILRMHKNLICNGFTSFAEA